MKEPLAGRPKLAAGFQQIEGAFDVGVHKGARPCDRAIHVALGRKMHHDFGLVAGKHGPQRGEIAQVGPFKGVVGQAGHWVQAAQIGGVGQRVQVDELVLGVARHQEIEEVRADEAGAAGDQDSHVFGIGKPSPAATQ